MSGDSLQSIPRPPARWLAIAAFFSGSLTMLLGLGLALIGMGFQNATASGTGMTGFCVGLWTMLACRGLWRRRAITLLGLSAAWLWLVGRIVWDWPATAVSTVVVLFLLPLVTLSLGAVWALFTTGFLASLVRRCVRAIRQHRLDSVAFVRSRRREEADSEKLEAPPPPEVVGYAPSAIPARRFTRWQWIGLSLRWLSVIGMTLAAPQLVWLERADKLKRLEAEFAPTNSPSAAPVVWGACSSVFLGYELTQHGAEGTKDSQKREAIYERALADARADLESIHQAGARYVRAGASGDHLVQPNPDQERLDDRYIAAARQTGMNLVLVDTQHPKALRNRRMNWTEFCKFQRDRIEYYQRRYAPEIYFVVCEPMSYHGFALTPETKYSAEAWATQLSDMCRLVKSLRPTTRTGICLLVMPEKEPEWDVWSRMKTLPELDILSVEIYSPENFQQTLDRLNRYGHPRDAGKAFWIAETYNGWALCGERRWDQDAAWIRVTDGFAQRSQSEAVLVWTFGSFVPGGNFWDFGKGRLSERWNRTKQLSPVAEAFQRVAR